MSSMRDLLSHPTSSASTTAGDSIAASTSPAPASHPPPGCSSRKQRSAPPNGMSREVYRLCGEGLVSLPTSFIPSQPSSVVSSSCSAGNRGAKGMAGPWRMACFTNSAAANKRMKLRHWSKSSHLVKLPVAPSSPSSSSSTPCTSSSSAPFFSTPPDTSIPCEHIDTKDYTFSAFSTGTNNISPTRCVSTRVLNYTVDMYNKYIAPTDTTWTKAETDILFDLCNLFDLRFFVVHDRYPKQFKRSIEALKHRYYSIARILTELKYEARINAEMCKIQNVTGSNSEGASTSSPLYTQTMAIVNRLRDERARDPILKFVYSPTADVERKQHVHKIMTKTSAHKLSEKQIVETIKKQTIPQQQHKHHLKTGTSHSSSSSSRHHASNAPSVHLSSAGIDKAKTAGERQRSELIDNTLDEKVPQTSAASLRLVSYPYLPLSPSPSASVSATSPSSMQTQQPSSGAIAATSCSTPSTAVCGPVGGVGVSAASKQHAETTGMPVSSSVWLQPYHIFTLHTSTYFPPNPNPPHFLPSTQQPFPLPTPVVNLPGSGSFAHAAHISPSPSPPSCATSVVGGGSSISPLPCVTPDLISSFSRVRTELCSTLIASLRLDIALGLSLREKLAALKKELQHWESMSDKQQQQEPHDVLAKQQQQQGGAGGWTGEGKGGGVVGGCTDSEMSGANAWRAELHEAGM
eukprot:GHVS01079880.1.p1 GENE.GHVS01079880.1~~GHVS01079880.1.p1  ORF type:complete len:689 (-),score=146.60 GHVS01079880.1:461-2527(-)